MSKSLSLRYKFHTQKIVITSLFYEQKIMIPIIIPVAHCIYFPVLSDLCRTSKSSFSCCRVDHLGWPRKNAVPSRSLLGESRGHPHVPKQRVEGNSTKASEHIYAEKEHLKTLCLIKEASNMNNHRQIKDYRWKRPKEDAKLKREQSPKMSHPRWRQSRPEHGRNVVLVPHFPWQRNSVYRANRTLGPKISKKIWEKRFFG